MIKRIKKIFKALKGQNYFITIKEIKSLKINFSEKIFFFFAIQKTIFMKKAKPSWLEL